MNFSIKLNWFYIKWILIVFVILSTLVFVYYKGYSNGKHVVQLSFDKYKESVKKNTEDKNKEIYDETTRLNDYWKGQIKIYEDEKIKLQSRIDSINDSNNRLSNDIEAYRKRERDRSNSTNTTNNETQTAWLLFENRRRIDSERIKDAESINQQLIQAKDYIENICTK